MTNDQWSEDLWKHGVPSPLDKERANRSMLAATVDVDQRYALHYLRGFEIHYMWFSGMLAEDSD